MTDKPDRFKFLKRHLQTQIRAADRIGSKWVYILREEAEKCLQLAEAEDTIFSDPVHPELEGEEKPGSMYAVNAGETSVHLTSFAENVEGKSSGEGQKSQ